MEYDKNTKQEHSTGNRISSETLALFIIDALIDGKVISQDEFQKAMEIAVEEIDARKAAGDY